MSREYYKDDVSAKLHYLRLQLVTHDYLIPHLLNEFKRIWNSNSWTVWDENNENSQEEFQKCLVKLDNGEKMMSNKFSSHEMDRLKDRRKGTKGWDLTVLVKLLHALADHFCVRLENGTKYLNILKGRNDLAHRSNIDIGDQTFNTYWTILSEILIQEGSLEGELYKIQRWRHLKAEGYYPRIQRPM